ncbi:MAG: ABC transporter substrate-binding protein [Bdellovibrionota bacterium]
MKLTTENKILFSRILTRSGDQAWDFAVPLVLLMIFPDQLKIAALYYFLVKLVTVMSLPKLTSFIDRLNRLKTARLGIALQLVGVIVGTAAIFQLSTFSSEVFNWDNFNASSGFVFLVLGGILSSLGSGFMDIAIANDLVPSTINEKDLSKFNSRLRQVDLLTEVTSPVIAGLILMLDQPLLLGFFIVAIWNVISFFPELALLQSIFRDRPDLMEKKIQIHEFSKRTIFEKLTLGWRAFFKEPVALVALAYSFLWLSVLSPHGVLLAAYLKDGWQLPEWGIGTFRGMGAIFGLLATFLYPIAEKKWGLLKGTRNFIVYQTAALIIALVCFFQAGIFGQVGFLVFILLSRIGLYGFSLGEMQIRQIGINANVRGEVNGFATALTGIATLALYGAGALLPTTEDFKILVVGSVVFVGMGCWVYLFWLRTTQFKPKSIELEP